jgi:hypothetical protein
MVAVAQAAAAPAANGSGALAATGNLVPVQWDQVYRVFLLPVTAVIAEQAAQQLKP